MIRLVETCAPKTCQMPLRLAERLFAQLYDADVRYCHWKSNESLLAALAGVGDLDLLVHGEDCQRFQMIVTKLGFKLFAQPAWQTQPSVVHLYGHDAATGKLLHLHVYYRLVTGGHLLKNYRLPLEKMLLSHCHLEHGVLVADRAAELAVFVLRKMLESGNWVELVLQRLDRAHLQRELRWLLSSDGLERTALLISACGLLADHLPQLDRSLWRAGVAMLYAPESLSRQHALGRQFRSRMKSVALRGSLWAATATLGRVAGVLTNRLLRRRSRKWPAHGGSVIALIGPEASGKSTYSKSLCTWLADVMVARTVHLGKPAPSWLSRLAHVARPLFAPHSPTSPLSHSPTLPHPRHHGWPYAVASVLLARDRYRMAARVYRAALRGTIIVCDRYPSQQPEAVDGPRLTVVAEGLAGSSWLVRWAARIEQSYYRQIPPADVVLQLAVPVAVAQVRNRQRVKEGKEDDVYLARRHRQFHAGCGESSDGNEIVDTTASMDDVMQQLRTLVWKRL